MEPSNRIIYLDTIDSTNSYLHREKPPAGTIVYTFRQSAGRGRQGKSWIEVNDRNLALSVLFGAAPGEAPFWRIALLSLPMADFLKSLKVGAVWIKWPNDILAGGKKIAGVLAETLLEENRITGIIAGIGINVNTTAEELTAVARPATSIFCETGRLQDLDRFAEEYLERLLRLLRENPPPGVIRERWLAGSGIIGRTLAWASPAGAVHGCAVNVDEEGLLWLETDGGIVKVAAGDVDLR